MRMVIPLLTLSVLTGCGAADARSSSSSASLGEPAPDFTLRDLSGEVHTLSEYRGKTVVLEWFNPGCPFVEHTHEPGGALAGVAAKEMEQGVVWLAVNSGAPGRDGSVPANNEQAAARWALSHPILLDPEGTVGHAYGASVTPHLFVVDAQGILVYDGAPDNRPLGMGLGARVPYLVRALDELKEGKAVRTPHTRAYGCPVKYAE